jgi:hypothetical protein
MRRKAPERLEVRLLRRHKSTVPYKAQGFASQPFGLARRGRKEPHMNEIEGFIRQAGRIGVAQHVVGVWQPLRISQPDEVLVCVKPDYITTGTNAFGKVVGYAPRPATEIQATPTRGDRQEV